MKKEILIIGIICLFIGVGIQPAFAVDISNDTTTENVEDCNCQVADDYDIVRVKSLLNRAERLINRVELYTKLITTFSKDNAEVKEDCEELSDEINTFREMNEELRTAISGKGYPIIICAILNLTVYILYKATYMLDGIIRDITGISCVLISIFMEEHLNCPQ